MNVKENKYLTGSWVKISDVQIEMPSSGYSYMSADVHIPCGVTMLDLEEYTKFVQDETIKKFADGFILNGTPSRVFNDNSFKDVYTLTDICKRYKGSELISKIDAYNKMQQDKKAAEKQKKIKEAKELLENEGYIVAELKEKKR